MGRIPSGTQIDANATAEGVNRK
ncbi:hypothetical protein CCACVL1_03713 [Corchorus capsularis]|uniref:Uncharacterized protein n=1 Tax=Corchorus capsularis TaxID=210143 RepID=A0A1R3JXJ6_COCAP|nr:hypothetical protein CCACVL1_03713 [Corchorus capsularis]